jgi:uncharacterized protein YcbK (DUF882 family)
MRRDDSDEHKSTSRLGRRTLLLGGIAAALGATTDAAYASLLRAPERSLYLANAHTGDVFKDVYWAKGKYLKSASQDLAWLMRDHRAERMTTMDLDLYDLLFHIQSRAGSKKPVYIMSGYRSQQTNLLLAQEGVGVAENSLHLVGKAADIHIERMRLSDVRRIAVALKAGGVGTYPRGNFLHVDTGRVRFW